MSYHNPVMLGESVEGLDLKKGGVYVDVTYGGGGHSSEILKRLSGGRLFGFDQDIDAERNKVDDERLVLVGQNFRYMKNYLKMYGVEGVDGVLADLGVSSHQFNEVERGFSIRFDGPLDMRMNRGGGLTAEKVVNEYEELELIRVLRSFGEVKNARRLASEIVMARAVGGLATTFELIEVLDKCVVGKNRNRYLAQVFQAIRIEVNDEMKVLQEFLEQSAEVLKVGGRLAVITYHSLEDRLVKNFLKSGNFEGKIEKDFYGNALVDFKLVNRKPIVPSDEELEINNRARSAKLRVAEKL